MEGSANIKTNLEMLFEELDAMVLNARGTAVYRTILEIVERPLIEKVLERTFGNQIKAAKILGINRNTLRAKIGKYGIRPDRWKI